MIFETFVGQVRAELCRLGLPLNGQPPRESLHVFHATGWNVADTVNYYRTNVVRYEAFVHKESACLPPMS